MLMKNNFSNDVFKTVEREVSLITTRYSSHSLPKAYLLAGQPGAGKTLLSAYIARRYDGDIVLLNADEYKRYFPKYHDLIALNGNITDETAKFAGEVIEELIDKLSDSHVNLIVEGTGRTIEVPQKTAEKLWSNGYKVELYVIAARPELSFGSTLLRYCKMLQKGMTPRATPAEAHDHIVSVLPKNLDALVTFPAISCVTIIDRGLNVLFKSSSDTACPSAALRKYWISPWCEDEIKFAEEVMLTLGNFKAVSSDKIEFWKRVQHRIRKTS